MNWEPLFFRILSCHSAKVPPNRQIGGIDGGLGLKLRYIELGAEFPRYEILGTGIRVYSPALKSALIDQSKAPKHQNTETHGALDDAMVLRIIEKLKEQPDLSQEALGESLGVTRRVV